MAPRLDIRLDNTLHNADSYGFLRLCRLNQLRPRRCIMVEDMLENLRTAASLGMKTVWITKSPRAPG